MHEKLAKSKIKHYYYIDINSRDKILHDEFEEENENLNVSDNGTVFKIF